MMPVMRSNSWIPSVFNDLFDTDFIGLYCRVGRTGHEKGGFQCSHQR